jgi:hypothetical protein
LCSLASVLITSFSGLKGREYEPYLYIEKYQPHIISRKYGDRYIGPSFGDNSLHRYPFSNGNKEL